jgi:hypothetical protein
MLSNRNWILYLAALALLAGACFAQDATPTRFYKLEFVVKEVEGTRVLNSRAYSVTASTDKGLERCQIRTGSKVPLPATGPGVGSGQFTYIDVGVSLDCSFLKETQVGISLQVSADISSLPQESSVPVSGQVIRQNRWTSHVVVQPKKPTVIFSSDDLTTKHQMQLELTATPIT